MHYVDAERPDGTRATKQVKRFLGNLSQMSERAARREHARIMEEVNQSRGSVMPIVKGQTFADAVNKWRQAIAPNLCPSTVRQRESYLKNHMMPRFGRSGLLDLNVDAIQQFATDLRKTVSGKTTLNILGAVFTIIEYAGKCGMRVAKVSFADLQLGSIASEKPVAFFTREQAERIIEEAREPFKTLFNLAWLTGLRAGEILALTLDDLNFDRKTIRVNKASDDLTREIRQPKTKGSVALLPMPSALEGVLRNYIQKCWKPNPSGLLTRHPEREHRASCVQTRPCNGIGRQFCASNRAAKSAETRGREDNVENIRPPHPTVAARRNGENWRAPIITFNQYVT